MSGKILSKLLCLMATMVLSCVSVRADVIAVKTSTNLKAIYLIEDAQSDQITINPIFLAGEIDFEGPEGLSHYLEHLMFWHADKAGGKSLHGRGGNAWVNGIVTSYYNRGIASELEPLFEFATRLLQLPNLDKQFMLDELRIVEREYDLRVSENADRRLFTQMQRQVYGLHPAGRSVIGTRQSIRSLTQNHANSFHRKYYNLSNMVLIITGNLDVGKVRALVEKSFKGTEAGMPNSHDWRRQISTSKFAEKIILRTKNLESKAYKYSALSRWTGSGDRLQDYYSVWITRNLLNSALAGSLSKPLRLDNFVVSGFSAGIDMLLEGQINMTFSGRPDDGVGLDDLAAKFKSALAEIARAGVPQASIERIRKRMIRKATRLTDDAEYNRWRVLGLLRNGIAPNNAADNLQRIMNIEKNDIDSLLKALAKPTRQVDGYLEKETK